MSKWVVILHESKTEDEDVIRRAVKEGGGEVVWLGDQRPVIYVQFQPRLEKSTLTDDPRLSKPL